MKGLLILPKIKIEHANCISGIVYGFPAISHFLGFVHALWRDVKDQVEGNFTGVGIVCHGYKMHTHKAGYWNDSYFALTRNPLTDKGKSPSFNEEGRVNLEISLIIACDFAKEDIDFGEENYDLEVERFCQKIRKLALSKRIAGGIPVKIAAPEFHPVSRDEKAKINLFRKLARKLMPGFFLSDCSRVLEQYIGDNSGLTPFEALLDFCTLKHAPKISEEVTEEVKANLEKEVEWELVRMEAKKGWVVPIQVGYRAISPTYPKGQVACARDKTVPFRFVEPVYSLGEWKGVYRLPDQLQQALWSFTNSDQMYLIKNKT